MMSNRFQPVPADKIHHVLGPRTAFLIGSRNADGGAHLCAASNVTNLGIDPQLVVVGLWPEWTSTANILREGELTINLMDDRHLDDIWIVGNKYSKVDLRRDDDKFVVGGFSHSPSQDVAPDGVGEALAILECRVVKVLDDLSDHTIFLANVVSARCQRQFFDSDYVIDVHRVHPVMQTSYRYFARGMPCAVPDTDWCSQLAEERRAASSGR
jgi:flavin reductase (DIM6/NTAB) family NADH-FMN oxidoreductase RutF